MKPGSSFAESLFIWKKEKERKERKRNKRKEKKGNVEGRKEEVGAWMERNRRGGRTMDGKKVG